MIQFVTVSKKYDNDYEALNEINFEIQDGEFAFLVGPSGSGKTTIIKLLIREEVPSSGKIYFDDQDITKFNRQDVYSLRRKIGVIFQDFKLINELTAYENIAFVMEAAGKPEKEILENVPYLLDIVGLSSRMKAFPEQLSGGEKQRVAIARAMANNPKLLIADEPTGNLDPETAWDIAQILYKINNWGTTVLMSTHGSDIVNSMHKRVIRLQKGQIIRDDYKGGYDDVDEYSMKILTSNDSDKPIQLISNQSRSKTENTKSKDTEEEVVTEQKDDQPSKKEAEKPAEKVKKKISFSVKSKTPKIVLNARKNSADTPEDTLNKSIDDSGLNENLIKTLKEIGYSDIESLKEKGIDHLRNIDKLTDVQIKQIEKLFK